MVSSNKLDYLSNVTYQNETQLVMMANSMSLKHINCYCDHL
jgi:hypothetical protein